MGGAHSPYRQSDRLGIYRDKALQLVQSGRAYHCFCSEAELEKQAEKAKEDLAFLGSIREPAGGCPNQKCSSGCPAAMLQSFA